MLNNTQLRYYDSEVLRLRGKRGRYIMLRLTDSSPHYPRA
jgi:hypothetical protein